MAKSEACVACGHLPSDHAEGYMGATINDAPYCHQDDHSCYLPAHEFAGDVMNGLDAWDFLR